MTELTARTDRSLIRAAARSVRYVVATVVAPLASRTGERPPLDVAFVLDRSGSMGGEKIDLARDAILQGIAMLKPADRFAVVAYDDRIEDVVWLTQAGAESRAMAEHRLRQIDARGSTDLGGGWLRGCQLVAEADGARGQSRALLMSDGLANQGITDSGELERHARELQRRGVVTTSFGVGADFDEELMTGLARAGGGNGYFIQHARQIGDLLTSELAEAIELVARRATMTVAPPPGANVEVLSDFDATVDGGGTRIQLGNLVSGQSLAVVLKVTFPTGAEGGRQTMRVRVDADESALQAAPVELAWTFASHEANDAQARDVAADVAVARIYAARARREALRRNRDGDFTGARKALERTADRIDRYAARSRELGELARELRREARRFEHEMPAMARKAVHYSATNMLTARMESGKAARTRFDSEPFDVELRNGVPVLDCHGVRAAVVTGAPRSFGNAPVVLLGRRHRLPSQAAPGVTVETISGHLGTRIDAVIGADLLAQHECLIDLAQRRVVFSNGSLGMDGVSLRTPLQMDVPTADVRVGRHTGIAFLDTGARLSYLDPSIASGAPVARERDFFPLLGEFETDVYEMEIELAGLRFKGRFGVLPAPLGQQLQALGARWVIGSELLRQFPLLLDLRNHRIMVVHAQAVVH